MDTTRYISDEEGPAEREARQDKLVLSLMLDDGCAWTVEELGRELDDPIRAVDAVARLAAAGLVHRVDAFVYPTRTARRAAEMEVGTL
ncbi:MAG TPA: hypothetical protein VGF95_06520 [Solirubrobacteraceae bacterium]|jgi:hypothetical protein